MTTSWSLGPKGTIKHNGQVMPLHWVVAILNQCENDLALWNTAQQAAWALINQDISDIDMSDAMVSSRELWNQLETALLAANDILE